ncbi:MAG: antibiotic biosynthesis monooxygenase family protein [Bacteroidota bacterium]
MLIRIVRMEFQTEKIPEFLDFFHSKKSLIQAFDGCLHLELCRDNRDEHVYYTLSHWTDEKALDAYRQSDFFEHTWKYTKTLFSGKAQAFSLMKN